VTREAHHRLHLVEAAIVGDVGADMVEAAIDALLSADRGGLAGVARPAPHRVAAAEADVERAADVTLGRRREAREFLHLNQRQRAVGWLGARRHEPTPTLNPAEIMRFKELPAP
jgi:hypothetical protein